MFDRKYEDNPDLFMADFEELKEIGAPNETLSKVLGDYPNMQENPKLEWIEELWSVFLDKTAEIIVTIVGGVCVVIIAKNTLTRKEVGKDEVASLVMRLPSPSE